MAHLSPVKDFCSSHGGWKFTLEMKIEVLGKISLLPLRPLDRKLQKYDETGYRIAKLATFACIYYRDTRAVFTSIEKAKRFWHTSS